MKFLVETLQTQSQISVRRSKICETSTIALCYIDICYSPFLLQIWTDEETDWVKKGVAYYGEGRWEKIKCAFPFKGRTAVNIKDRWRTMKKSKMV